MHQGNLKCSTCGGAITELPFVPRSEAGLTCRACYMKNKSGGESDPVSPASDIPEEMPLPPDDAGLATEPAPDDSFESIPASPPGEKPRFTGDWVCSGCGAAITSLPFTPKTTSNLKCLDCYRQSKA